MVPVLLPIQRKISQKTGTRMLRFRIFVLKASRMIKTKDQAGEWVASIDLTDAYFHVPIHPKFQKYLRFHVQGQAYQFRALPFGIATAPLEFTRVVKEVKFIALSQGVRIHQYLDDWLVRAKDRDTCSRDVQKLITLVEKLGWIVNLKKSELNPTQNSGSFHFARSHYYSKEARVTAWGHVFHGEDSSFGSNPYEAVSVVSEDQLAVSPALDKIVPISQLIKDHLAWWMDPQNVLKGSNLHQKEHNMLMFTDASEKGWGPLEQLYCKWGLAAIRKRLAYQYFRAESCFSKTFSKTIEAKNRASFFRQLNCDLLYQQGRRHSLLRNVCPDVENSGMVECQGDPYQSQAYSRESQCDSRFPIQEGQGHSDKWSLHPLVFQEICQVWHKPMVDLFATRLNAKLPTYVSPVPDDKAWQIDALNISWEGLDAYAFCPVAILPQFSSENDHLQVQGHCDSTRVARDALVFGSGGIVSQDSTEASSSAQSPKATLQSQIPQESGVSESPCVVSGLL